mgnify:CR=1 FL=1
MSEGGAQGEHYEAIKHAVEKAIDKLYSDSGCRRPGIPVSVGRFDSPSRRISEASEGFRDHFARAGEEERIRRKARIYAQALINEPGLQHAIPGYISHLKRLEDS